MEKVKRELETITAEFQKCPSNDVIERLKGLQHLLSDNETEEGDEKMIDFSSKHYEVDRNNSTSTASLTIKTETEDP